VVVMQHLAPELLRAWLQRLQRAESAVGAWQHWRGPPTAALSWLFQNWRQKPSYCTYRRKGLTEKKRKEKKRKEKKRKEKKRKEKKRKEKTTPFGVNLMRGQVLYWAAQY